MRPAPPRRRALYAHRRTSLLVALTAIAACHPTGSLGGPGASTDAAPPPPPERWLGLLGEYGPAERSRIVLERDGRLMLRASATDERALVEQSDSSFLTRGGTQRIVFRRAADGRMSVAIADTVLLRRQLGPESGNQLVITPTRPIAELRREALASQPPVETGPFRPSDLVELVRLDPTIKLEIRYTTTNNLFATPFYTEARAFLQRPAAEALVRVNAALRPRGFGLLVHDGYRPWYVTKMFWDATPEEKHIFVADPALGSKHNRGAAVDLTLYDLATGAPVEMVSTYDETSPRAYPDYPGGTSRQRWHRDLLRRAMEAQGFTVYEAEWWHFDYADWKQYPIGNVDFSKIP